MAIQRFPSRGNYSFGTQEQVEQAQELLNLPLMDNWIDSSDPKNTRFPVDKNSKSRECHDKNLPSSGHSRADCFNSRDITYDTRNRICKS